MALLTGAGVVGDGTALLEAAGLDHEASGKFRLRQRYEENISSGVEVAFINAAGAPGGGSYTPLVCDVMSGSSQAPRVARLLMDAGADPASVFRGRNWEGELIFNDTPLAFTTSCFRRKVVAYDATRYGGAPAQAGGHPLLAVASGGYPRGVLAVAKRFSLHRP
ncbi:unnamed protein product [Ectocarpus sp. 12 AP-2014]